MTCWAIKTVMACALLEISLIFNISESNKLPNYCLILNTFQKKELKYFDSV